MTTTYITFDKFITLTRPGKSWRIVNGVIREYDVNEPCLTGDVLSLRPAETNQWKQSQNFASSDWTRLGGVGVTLRPDIPGPDQGASPSHAVVPPAATTTWRQLLQTTLSVEEGKDYTQFWIAKPFGYNFIQLNGSYAGWGDFYVNFDLRDGSIVKQLPKANLKDCGSIPMKDGWWLVWTTATALATASNVSLTMNVIDDGNRERGESWTADGSSGILLFAAQHNEGDLIPYIPTTSGAVTRPADNTSIQDAAFASVWNPVEGAIVLDLDTYPTALGTWNTARPLQTPVGYWWVSSENVVRFLPTGKSDISINDSARSKKLGVSWSGTSISIFYNGSLVEATTFSGSNPAVDTIRLAGSQSSQLATNNRRLTIFNRRLSDAEMQAMTS